MTAPVLSRRASRLLGRERADTAAAGRVLAGAVRAVVAAAAGGCLALAFPPLSAWPVAVVGVALLALACRGCGVRGGAALGLLAGLGLFLPLLSWSATVVGAPPWLLLALFESLFVALLGAGLAVVADLPGWPVWVGCLWLAEEYLRDRVPFGGFPWGRLAFSQAGSPLVRLAALGGAPLVSFAVALAGGLLAAALLRFAGGSKPGRRPALGLAALGAAAAVPALALAVPLAGSSGPSMTVALVQGDVPRLGLDAFDQAGVVLADHVAATRQLAADVRAGRLPRPRLVVWPENASDFDPYTDPAARAEITSAVRSVGAPTLVGAVLSVGAHHLHNVGIVWSPRTGPGQVYVKRHLVPFGEYIPFRSLVSKLSADVSRVPRDFVAGSRPGVLRVAGTTVGDVICFEVAYDGLVRDVVTGGGRVIVVQTNNATFGHSAESAQQLAMGRLRAVEHGRAVLVAATSGISAVIAPDGSVQARSKVFTRAVLVARVPLRSALTPADRVGPAPEQALAGLGVAAVALALLRRRRTGAGGG